MKKLFLTTAVIFAAASSAQAVDAPSLGDRLRDSWDANTSRATWNAPVKHEAAFPGALGGTPNSGSNEAINQNSSVDDRVRARDMNNNGHMHHDHMKNMTPEQRAAKKAEWDKMTPEQKAAKRADMKNAHHEKMANMTSDQKAKMRADRKAKWDAMTPEQKAAWKAKHAARKSAPAASTTSATPAADTK